MKMPRSGGVFTHRVRTRTNLLAIERTLHAAPDGFLRGGNDRVTRERDCRSLRARYFEFAIIMALLVKLSISQVIYVDCSSRRATPSLSSPLLFVYLSYPHILFLLSLSLSLSLSPSLCRFSVIIFSVCRRCIERGSRRSSPTSHDVHRSSIGLRLLEGLLRKRVYSIIILVDFISTV